MFETILHVAGNRTYVLEFENELFLMDPGFDCENQSIDGWDPVQSPTTGFVIKLIARVNKPLKHVFVSHHHRDHSFNIPYFMDLKKEFPDRFPFELIVNENYRCEYENVIRISGDTRLTIEGNDLWILQTPGHTRGHNDISLWFPGEALLFAGDLIQPQGDDLKFCNFSTPVSNHHLSNEAIQSLKKLSALPFKILLMGHEGVILNSLEGLNAIEITIQVLELEREYVEYVLKEYPDETRETQIDLVFEMICEERGVSQDTINRRKTESHSGKCPYNSPDSYFQLYDAPSIISFFDEKI